MGFMELRAGTIGFRVPSSRGEETVNTKTQTQGKSFLFLFLSENGI